jgi:Flp pilus assembly protein TadD
MRSVVAVAAVLLAAAALTGCGGGATPEARRPEMSSSDRTKLRRQLAFSLASHREWAAASQPLLELVAQHPEDAELHTLLGTVYREQGLFTQADASYKKAITLAPNDAAAYAGRGILREVSGDTGDAAVDDFRTAVRLAPNEAAYANNLGFALYVRRRYAEAEVALQQGLARAPLSARMRNNLGFVYGKLGQYDRAQREFGHGGSTDEARNNLGWVYEQAGDTKNACAQYRSALTENPQLATATENAARVCPRDASPERSSQ